MVVPQSTAKILLASGHCHAQCTLPHITMRLQPTAEQAGAMAQQQGIDLRCNASESAADNAMTPAHACNDAVLCWGEADKQWCPPHLFAQVAKALHLDKAPKLHDAGYLAAVHSTQHRLIRLPLLLLFLLLRCRRGSRVATARSPACCSCCPCCTGPRPCPFPVAAATATATAVPAVTPVRPSEVSSKQAGRQAGRQAGKQNTGLSLQSRPGCTTKAPPRRHSILCSCM